MTGNELLSVAQTHLGQNYELDVVVPKSDRNWRGPWNCSEFVSWCVFQVAGRLYGCLNDSGNPATTPAYTGYWARDADSLGIKISVEQARVTPGAAVLRIPLTQGAIGHVVLSDGSGGTIEAHGAATGVIRDTLEGRRWDCGILVPGIQYSASGTATAVKGPVVIYRLSDPLMQGDTVQAIQLALVNNGFDPGPIDGKFGWHTASAVIGFQKTAGVLADGEVGPRTALALGITLGTQINPDVVFGALVPGGFFSSDPEDLNVRRSIRTNNPGALNYSLWQQSRLGYVGITQPDSSSSQNRTSIYRTPEHGVAAWFHLVSQIYFPGGEFSLNDLALRYAGSNNPARIHAYITGWNIWLDPQIDPSMPLSVSDSTFMLNLGKAMFSHEAGIQTPLHDDQITFAIEREIEGTLPA